MQRWYFYTCRDPPEFAFWVERLGFEPDGALRVTHCLRPSGPCESRLPQTVQRHRGEVGIPGQSYCPVAAWSPPPFYEDIVAPVHRA